MKQSKKVKIIMIACAAVVFLFAVKGIKERIALSKVVTNMAIGENGTEITGLWDETKMDRYTCIAIPNPAYYVSSVNKGMYNEYAKVTSISQGAFRDNTYVETVYIPANIVLIEKDAFAGCDNLTEVLYSGTRQEWEQIEMEQGNDVLRYASKTYDADMPKNNDYGMDLNN